MRKTLSYVLSLSMLAAPVMAFERVGNAFILSDGKVAGTKACGKEA